MRFVARPDGMYRMTGQRAARISGRRFVSAYVAEAGDGRIWMAPISSVSTRLDTVEGDSLGTECRACLPSSLRAVLDTLRSLEIVDMGADAFGRVWIAAGRSGLVCIYQTEQGTWESRRLQTSDGLLSDEVHALFPTPDGGSGWGHLEESRDSGCGLVRRASMPCSSFARGMGSRANS